MSVEERFWAKVHRSGECWEWSGARDHGGYGTAWMNGACRGAHRVAYQLAVGPIPEGLELDHLCRNRPCVRPDHLQPVTRLEHQRRSVKATKTACVNGHPFTDANTYRRPNGTRDCRTCIRARVAKYRRAVA